MGEVERLRREYEEVVEEITTASQWCSQALTARPLPICTLAAQIRTHVCTHYGVHPFAAWETPNVPSVRGTSTARSRRIARDCNRLAGRVGFEPTWVFRPNSF